MCGHPTLETPAHQKKAVAGSSRHLGATTQTSLVVPDQTLPPSVPNLDKDSGVACPLLCPQRTTP